MARSLPIQKSPPTVCCLLLWNGILSETVKLKSRYQTRWQLIKINEESRLSSSCGFILSCFCHIPLSQVLTWAFTTCTGALHAATVKGAGDESDRIHLFIQWFLIAVIWWDKKKKTCTASCVETKICFWYAIQPHPVVNKAIIHTREVIHACSIKYKRQCKGFHRLQAQIQTSQHILVFSMGGKSQYQIWKKCLFALLLHCFIWYYNLHQCKSFWHIWSA